MREFAFHQPCQSQSKQIKVCGSVESGINTSAQNHPSGQPERANRVVTMAPANPKTVAAMTKGRVEKAKSKKAKKLAAQKRAAVARAGKGKTGAKATSKQ